MAFLAASRPRLAAGTTRATIVPATPNAATATSLCAVPWASGQSMSQASSATTTTAARTSRRLPTASP
jgi:hypothetical protein